MTDRAAATNQRDLTDGAERNQRLLLVEDDRALAIGQISLHREGFTVTSTASR